MKKIPAATLRVLVLGVGLGLGACSGGEGSRSMEVVATAYTLAEEETKQGNVGLAAWGDRLEPGMKAIAVSRDLIERGLSNGTRVRIEGLDGDYVVRDKMNKRWTKKIDIFMGNDRRRARQWGRQTVTIHWN
ncbi:3D domain-containing protein [Chromatocurvus halotolerans]|uniref:3D (Asp-Asp-Asp) domain-containing protein n=1 Tax=Chromatocurvus halotolerans TaxID=1132028 RepID=A0A4R2LGF3_9GAMM|nr:3D domain-containing protein [Chromatocurvus halotolerans]TCO78385.1 3D (Asp-Asp-Asp) domain-containing protein [Chromatocurvus halotolerans]